MMKEQPESSPIILSAISLSASAGVFFARICHLIAPHHSTVFHLRGSAEAYFVPVVTYILLLVCLVFAMLWATVTFPRMQRFLLATLIFATALAFLEGFLDLNNRTPGGFASACIVLLLLVPSVYLGSARSSWALGVFRRVWIVSRGALSIAGFVAGVTLLQIAWFGWEARHLNDGPQVSQRIVALPPAQHGRVIWIVLDELSYQQVYGRRYPGLGLPSFDRLRSESTVFTQAIPAGDKTQIVLPELMTGVPAVSVTSSADGKRLSLLTAHGAMPFNQYDTIFSDADRLGYRSGVVGWYNPYCRILPDVLASCSWSSEFLADPLFPRTTIGGNLAYPLVHLLQVTADAIRHGPTVLWQKENKAREHVQDLEFLERGSDAAIADRHLDFLLLHMPFPHPAGVFNRRTGRISLDESTSYVDNLALADIYLGRLRSALEAAHEWDDATLVVMGDHSWRTSTVWSHAPAWTAEDEAASDGGRFDPRPGYIVKLPHQSRPAEIDRPFAATRTRALLRELLARHIVNPEQLQQWVAGAPGG